jgi:molecular chaperone GrpE
MVNSFNDEDDVQIDITNEEPNFEELELEDEEASGADKMKSLRKKLSVCEEEKRSILEEAQREKADFLNARRRAETERAQDAVRYTKRHVERLLPLCDSFEMAMSDTVAWEKADSNWRKGIEGIHAQLQNILQSYGVVVISSLNQPFDPYKHEAIGTTPVTDKDLDGKVVSVLQSGYEMKDGDKMEVIRPARVSTGEYTN